MHTPITFELAKLLKEKGFEELCTGYYEQNNVIVIETTTLCSNNRIADSCFTAPTIAEVVMWLYEKHGIWISVNITKTPIFFWYEIKGKDNIWFQGKNHKTPTEAYLSAIEYTLKQII